MAEFLSNDLGREKKKKKSLFEEKYHIYANQASNIAQHCVTCGVRNLSILQERKGLSSTLLTEGLSRGLRLNSCAKRERRSWE